MPIPGALAPSSHQTACASMVGVASLVFPDLHLLRPRDVANASHGLCCGPRVVSDGNQVALVCWQDRSEPRRHRKTVDRED